MKEQGLFHTAQSPEAEYSDTMELDLSTVQASLAGPKRPQDRILLADVKGSFESQLGSLRAPGGEGGVASPAEGAVTASLNGEEFVLQDGSVVIAAITSCTNTSNPWVMVAAGLLAKKAVERGLESKPWVKTSLAPGSKVVTDYLSESGLMPYLEKLKFYVVGYGCTTCIGNSGPLPPPIAEAVRAANLVAVSVLSGNRNFEGRISSDVRANYLASPPLVVAYALAGRIDLDLYSEPLGTDSEGRSVFLKEIWPSQQEIAEAVGAAVKSEMFTREYAEVFAGDAQWASMPVPEGDTYAWADESTYVKLPPYFVDLPAAPAEVTDIEGARALAVVGDSITTDHISPAGAIKADSPAGRYLIERGVEPKDFNSYGSRRGNHEVMMRGTFANVRFRNELVPALEGGFTLHLPDEVSMTIFDAAMQYKREGVPLIVLAGKEYGTGSSRDWAAKGPSLLGVRAVVAESFERIHRSNLVGMGILPLEFLTGESVNELGLSGKEEFSISGLAAGLEAGFEKGMEVTVAADSGNGGIREFKARVRLDTPQESEYFRHGGILQYVL
jgi:aconitate hydratase